MKLISMTDFILEQQNRVPKDLNLLNNYSLIVSYANFLKQPLTLSMFVACDDNGNVMEELVYTSPNNMYYNKEYCNKYQQAKERVLFDGFILSNDIYLSYNKHEFLHKSELKHFNVEDLFFDIPDDLTLTPYALKQIGL